MSLYDTDVQGRNPPIKRCPYLGSRDYMKFIQVSLGLGKLSLKKEVKVR